MDGFPNQPPQGFHGGMLPGFHDGMRLYAERGGFEHHGGLHWFGLGFFFLLLIAVVLLVVALARSGFARRGQAGVAAVGSGAPDDALAILRLRYARGEIGRDDFLVAHSDLGGGPASASPLAAT